MSLKSGWCMDEVQYRDLGLADYAEHLHSKCRTAVPGTCPCEHHTDEESDDAVRE